MGHMAQRARRLVQLVSQQESELGLEPGYSNSLVLLGCCTGWGGSAIPPPI